MKRKNHVSVLTVILLVLLAGGCIYYSAVSFTAGDRVDIDIEENACTDGWFTPGKNGYTIALPSVSRDAAGVLSTEAFTVCRVFTKDCLPDFVVAVTTKNERVRAYINGVLIYE